MRKEDYNIEIKGLQILDDDSSEININTTGSYTKRNNTIFITYKEYDEEDPTKSTLAVLKIEGEKVTMLRAHSATRLILEKGQRHLCVYNTGYGFLSVGVFTSHFHSTLTENGGKLRLKYTLDIDSVLSSNNEIEVTVHPKESSEPSVQDGANG